MTQQIDVMTNDRIADRRLILNEDKLDDAKQAAINYLHSIGVIEYTMIDTGVQHIIYYNEEKK